MILRMDKVRILGPRGLLRPALRSIQELGLVHLQDVHPAGPLRRAGTQPGMARRTRQLERILAEIAEIERRWPLPPVETAVPAPDAARLAGWARLARRVRGRLARIDERRDALGKERRVAERYRHFFRAFAALPAGESAGPGTRVYRLILETADAGEAGRLREGLAATIGGPFELLTSALPEGDLAVVLVVPASSAPRVDDLLSRSRIDELPMPRGLGAETLGEALPAIASRLEEIRDEETALEREEGALRASSVAELARARAAIRDLVAEHAALAGTGETQRAFVVEGWLPATATERLVQRLATDFGEAVVVERLDTEEWRGESAPVALSNPRLFRPFEMITRTLPLPRYGSIDPTPFVAVFFPMFFGLILGDIGYGLVLAGLAGIFHLRSREGTTLRSVAEIAGACAAFSIIFGFLFGEFLGDLGRRVVGLRPLAFDRGEALLPFLGLAIALGLVHVVLGLGLGAVAAFRGHPRESLGRGVAAAMILLIVAALLVPLKVLPQAFFTPVIVALLVAFPILVIAEGIIAPIELLSTIGNILSYARIMALGTASVMMAVVANRMVGALGGAVVGVLFGLLFHLVNFAIGVFAPTIHALRLHYVEFFGKFYSPGGVEYRPYRRWRAETPAQS